MARRSEHGFTLPELLISLGLLGVVLSSVTGIVVSVQRGYVQQREVARAEDALRVAETTIAGVLRMARANTLGITGASAPRLEANPRSAAGFDNVRVVADFNPLDGNTTGLLEDVLIWVEADTLFVRWQAGQQPAPFAYPVRTLLFEYDSSGTALTTAAAAGRGATRVKVSIMAPRDRQSAALARRETWVHLRNRS